MSKANIKYVIKIFVFFLLISFVTDKVIYVILNRISDQVFTGQSIGKLNQYLQIKDNLDFVVFGSSRANHNINPTTITKNSFNMGVDGTLIAFSTALIKLLPQDKKQLVLLHVDPNNALSKEYNGNDIDALLTKYNRNNVIKNEINKLNQNKTLQNFYWSIGYNGKVLGILKNFFKPNYDYKNYSGYDPIFVTESQRNTFKLIIENEKPISCDNNNNLNVIYDTYLDELKLFCTKKKLIIFTSPEYQDKCKDDNIKFKQILKQKGLTYYDFTDFFKGNNSMQYWKDNSHLSDIGAEIFTDSLNLILKKEIDIIVK